MKTRTKVAAGIAGGAAVGAALGVLFAPKKGSETRKELMCKCNELISKVKNIKPEDVKEYINNKVDEIKKDLADLDKEKVAKDAQVMAKKIKKNAEDLVKYAKKKGTAELSKVPEDLRDKAIQVTEDVLAKLEKTK